MGYEDDLNLYQYVRNDPLNNLDPSGSQTVYGDVHLRQRDERELGIKSTQSVSSGSPGSAGGAVVAPPEAWTQTTAGRGAEVAEAAGDARTVQTAGTIAAMHAAGSSANDLAMVSKGMGQMGGAIAVVAEGSRVSAEVESGKDLGGAVAASTYRIGTTTSGATLGAFVGGPYGALVGGLVGAAIGEPGGEAMRERVTQDPICAASLTGCSP